MKRVFITIGLFMASASVAKVVEQPKFSGMWQLEALTCPAGEAEPKRHSGPLVLVINGDRVAYSAHVSQPEQAPGTPGCASNVVGSLKKTGKDTYEVALGEELIWGGGRDCSPSPANQKKRIWRIIDVDGSKLTIETTGTGLCGGKPYQIRYSRLTALTPPPATQ